MSRKYRAISSIMFALFMGLLATALMAGQGTQPAGKLVLFGDLNAFASPTNPNPCTAKIDSRRAKLLDSVYLPLTEEQVSPRLPPKSPCTSVPVERTYDLPTLFRGVPHKTPEGRDMPIRPGMWTTKWVVPDDAPTGTVAFRPRPAINLAGQRSGNRWAENRRF